MESTSNNDVLIVKGKTNQNKSNCGNVRGRHTKFKSIKFNENCFKCGKQGHRSSDCKSKRENFAGNSTEDAMPAIVLNVEPER